MKPRPFTPAGRLERLFANLIDTLILCVPDALCALAVGNAGQGLLAAFLCNVAYYTAFLSGKWQATPGKRLLNLHVIRTDGRKFSQAQALERFLAYTIPSLPIYLSFLPQNVATMLVVWLSLMWFTPILTTPQRTGVHDKLCGTRVVVGKADA